VLGTLTQQGLATRGPEMTEGRTQVELERSVPGVEGRLALNRTEAKGLIYLEAKGGKALLGGKFLIYERGTVTSGERGIAVFCTIIVRRRRHWRGGSFVLRGLMDGKSEIEKRATTSVRMPTKLVHWPYRMLFSLMYVCCFVANRWRRTCVRELDDLCPTRHGNRNRFPSQYHGSNTVCYSMTCPHRLVSHILPFM